MTTSQPLLYKENIAVLQDQWREKFLQRILVFTAIVGVLGLIPGILSADNLILQGIYVGAFAILVFTIIFNFPYIFKASVFVAIPFFLGISSTLNTGSNGNGLFFLLAFVTFSAILIGIRGSIIAIILSQTVIILIGSLVLSNQISLLNQSATPGIFVEWATDCILLLLFSAVVIASFRIIQKSFEQIQKQNKIMIDFQRENQSELENRITERTQELTRKSQQISASNLIAHRIASIQNLETLLNNSVDLVSKRFGYYHVAIYLINSRGDYTTLQSASSEGGKKLANQGYRLRIGVEGIVGFVAAEKLPRIAHDVGEDAFFFDSPDLPDTRSELAVPLIVRDKVIGVLDMQSTEVQAFRYDEIEMFQNLADQIAVAIENARLLTESQMTISQLEIISNENSRRNWQNEFLKQKPAFHYSSGETRPMKPNSTLDEKNTLSIPLILRGQKIGKISLQRKDAFQSWTAQEEMVAKEVANQTALALENVRLIERTRVRANREQEIARMAARIHETLDLDTVLRNSARELQSVLNLEEAEVRLFSQDTPSENENS